MFQPPTVPPLSEKPALDTVKTAITSVLSSDPNVDRKAAQDYLEALKNSVYAWETCDQLLQARDSIEISYLAAHMLRQKISRNFNELPLECYSSLKDSILNHLQVNEDYAVQGQLAMAVADLTLLLQVWQNPIEDLAKQLGLDISLMSLTSTNYETIYKGLHNRLVFACVLHQMCDLNHNDSERPCRIGAKRREEYEDYLISKCTQAITWYLNTYTEAEELKIFLKTTAISKDSQTQSENEASPMKCLGMIDKLIGQVYLCYSAWLRIFNEENINESFPLIDAAFKHLSDIDCPETIHKYAVEVIVVTTGYCADSGNVDYLINELVKKIYTLEQAFKQSINNEDMEKLNNFTKTFTSVAEIACLVHVIENKDFKLVELMLNCLNHYDYEVVEETYPFWWTFMELVQNRTSNFAPYVSYVNRFIMAMTKLYQFDPDEETVVSSDQDIHSFRLNSAELITRVMFVTTFEDFMRDNQILNHFQVKLSETSWEKNEAILYLLSCLIQMTTSYENKARVEIFNSIMAQQTYQGDTQNLIASKHVELKIGPSLGEVHPQIVATTLDLLSRLELFYVDYPDYLLISINYILSAISNSKYRNALIKPAAMALSCIMALNTSKHLINCPQLLAIVKDLCTSLDQFDDNAAGDLLKCSAFTANAIKELQIQDQFLFEILSHIIQSLKRTLLPPKQDDNEPVKYLDRLSSIFRQCDIAPDRVPELKNFIALIDSELWPSLMKVLELYASENGKVIEKTCRTIRYLLRCIKPQWMIERVAETMINLYKTYPQNSSPLYICSILVDEFANLSPEINRGLFAMLEIFCTLTFTLLDLNNSSSQQADSSASSGGSARSSTIQQTPKSLLTMKSYPETIDDMMRLFNRFMKKCPLEFSKFKALESIIELSICSLRIDHPDANSNVSKFLSAFIALGQQSQEYSHINDAVKNSLGARITDAVIRACLFDLPSSQISEEAQLLMTLNSFDKHLFSTWLDASISSLPRTNIQGVECVSMEQLNEFKKSLERADSMKRMYNTLRAHARLYN